MNLKELLYQYCTNYILDRINRIRGEINSAQDSANEETKSSAGDKHETARAMAQLDVEMNAKQLTEAEKLISALQLIRPGKTSKTVVPGSLVTTSNGIFYVAISIGIVKLNEQQYFVVSPDSPAGKLLIGKPVGTSVDINGQSYKILSID